MLLKNFGCKATSQPRTRCMTQQAHNTSSASEVAVRRQGRPLAEVVSGLVRKWFQDTLEAAKSGDSEQMGVLSSMLDAGYGCTADPQQAKIWAHKAATPQSNA
ncbi:hypothetical protein ABBQ32_006104 [Trebouxia sp. C0010 RCD-2024]